MKKEKMDNWFKKISKNQLRLISISVIIGLLYFGVFRSCYRTDFGVTNEYYWLFKDSIRSKIDTIVTLKDSRSTDYRCMYHFVEGIDPNCKANQLSFSYFSDNINYYVIDLWRFNNLQTSVDSVLITSDICLDNADILHSITLDSDSELSDIVSRSNDFMTDVSVEVDNISSLERIYKPNHYKGFYGRVKRVLFRDSKGVPQIIFNFKSKDEPTMMLFFKNSKGTYLLVINSHKPFDSKILDIFNLDK